MVVSQAKAMMLWYIHVYSGDIMGISLFEICYMDGWGIFGI
jgi:hypothetical protein